MIFSKKLLPIIFILGTALATTAQNAPEGEYLSSHYNTKKVVFTPKSGGFFKAEFFLKDDNTPTILNFKPLEKGGNVFEAIKSGGEVQRLVYQDGVIKHYDMSRRRQLQEIYALAKTKKELRKTLRSLENDDKKGGDCIAQYPTSEFHQKNAGKVVFFSEKPTVGKEDLTKIKTHFKVGEPVWAVAYLVSPLSEYWYESQFTQQKELKFAMGEVPEGSQNTRSFGAFGDLVTPSLSKADMEKNYAVFCVLPDAKAQHMKLRTALFIAGGIADLEPTNYKIGVGMAEASGRFMLDLSETHAQAKALAKTFEEQYLASKELPSPVMKDPALEAKILAAIQSFGTAAGWSETFKKVIITSPTWQTVTNKTTGNIIGRAVEAACVATWPDGHCTYQYFDFIQDHQGGGNYGEGIRRYATGYQTNINCSKIR